MKAAVVREFGQPLVIEDRPIPEPGPGQVTVRMEASGLCHTDIHAANGDWPVKPAPPFVPGHEGVGPVHAIGDGVGGLTHRAAGRRAMAGLRMRHLQALPDRLGDAVPAAAQYRLRRRRLLRRVLPGRGSVRRQGPRRASTPSTPPR